MGWLFSSEWPTKAAMIKHLTEPGEAFSAKVRTIAKAVRGNTLWSVIEYVEDGGTYPKGTRAIICFLLESDTKRGHGWGYKDMDESMGPCDISCPVRFLDMVPDPGGYATEWRAKVRAEAERKARLKGSLAVGATIVLRSGCKPARLTCTSVKPLRGEGPYGVIYRIPARHIDHVEAAHG